MANYTVSISNATNILCCKDFLSRLLFHCSFPDNSFSYLFKCPSSFTNCSTNTCLCFYRVSDCTFISFLYKLQMKPSCNNIQYIYQARLNSTSEKSQVIQVKTRILEILQSIFYLEGSQLLHLKLIPTQNSCLAI